MIRGGAAPGVVSGAEYEAGCSYWGTQSLLKITAGAKRPETTDPNKSVGSGFSAGSPDVWVQFWDLQPWGRY